MKKFVSDWALPLVFGASVLGVCCATGKVEKAEEQTTKHKSHAYDEVIFVAPAITP